MQSLETNMSRDGEESETYQVRLSGLGVNVERNVSQTTARQILDLVLGGTGAVGGVAARRGASPHVGIAVSGIGPERPHTSLREFLHDCGARHNPDKILAIGEYIVEVEGAEDFGREEVKSRFRNAGEPLPKNLPRDFTSTVQYGWIAPDPKDPDRFYVTSKGKEALAQKFSDGTKKASSSRQSARRRSHRTRASSEQVAEVRE